VEKDENGEIIRVKCTHDPATKGGTAPAGKKVDGTIHWVSAAKAVDVEARIYDRLFAVESPGEGDRDWLEDLNPRSLEVVKAKGEASLANAKEGDRFQFERLGYFYADPDGKPGAPVFNRTVALKDSWARATAQKPEAPRAEKKEKPAQQKPAAPVELSPEAKALVSEHGVSEQAARVIAQAPVLRELLERTIKAHKEMVADAATLLANVPADQRDNPHAGLTESALAGLIGLVKGGGISTNQAKEVFAEMWKTGKDAPAIVEAKGMKQIASADALGPIVDQVLAANADAVARFKAGNANVLGALVGLVMKASKGQANPKVATDLLKQKLG
jgi:glutaminyl-tRNA synthetase